MPSSPAKSEEFGKYLVNQLLANVFFIYNCADVVKYFLKLLDDDKDLSSGIAAIKTLLMILEKKQCK